MTTTDTMTGACWICGERTGSFTEKGEPLPCSPACCREVLRRIALDIKAVLHKDCCPVGGPYCTPPRRRWRPTALPVEASSDEAMAQAATALNRVADLLEKGNAVRQEPRQNRRPAPAPVPRDARPQRAGSFAGFLRRKGHEVGR